MSDLSRGDRARRGGRRPGWALLTVLLVLAIAASTALVFTNEVELLRLAVLLSLWAAVVGAFVSVIYRRQSDADQAKARDLKMVYNLQLDREISARREYELNVETQLRRELAHEIRAQSGDEVAALRAELAALRTNLEILFDADLSHRPAIEHDRRFADSYPEWAGQPASRPDRVPSSRITEVPEDSEHLTDAPTAESPIIDVPEEPLLFDEPAPPVQQWMPPPPPPMFTPPPPPPTPPNGQAAGADVEAERRGRHSSPAEPEPPHRHRGPEDDEAPTGGQSVAELLARLQHSGPTQGGRRRRRED